MKILTLISKILLFLLVFSSFPIQIPKVHAAAKLQKVAVNNLGLVGRWSFDGSDTTWTSATTGTTADTSGQGNTGTLTSMNRASSPGLGKIGQSFNFDGVDDHVSLTSDPIDVNTATACVWIYPKSLSVGQAVISNGKFVLFLKTDGTIFLSSDAGSTGSVNPSNVFAINTWYHVCAVRLSSGNGTVYINGAQAGTGSTGAISSGFGLGVGDRGYQTAEPFNGKIDEVRIYNRALSPSEISQMYNSGRVTAAASYRNVLTNGLVGLWTLDGADTSWSGATGGTTYDRSGLGNNGTINNSSRSSSVKSGVIGQAINFDQANDNINMGNITVLNGQGAATWSFWLYQTSYQNGAYYLSKDNPNVGTQESWAIYNENTSWNGSQDDIGVMVSSSLTSNLDLCIAQDADITLGQWMLVTVVFDGSQTGNTNRIKIYTNGVRRTLTGGDCNGTIPSSITNSSSAVVVGDSADASRGIDGGVTMDDIRIYNRALSDAEIKQLYNMGGSKVNSGQNNSLTSGLIGLWSFNGADVYWASSTSATAYDRSGQGKNGTVTNMSQKTSIVNGKVGQALYFNGNNSVVSLGSVGTYNLSTLTICAWIYPKTPPTQYPNIFSNVSGNSGFDFYIRDDGGLGTSFYGTTGFTFIETPAGTVTYDTKWQFVCGVQNGNSLSGLSLYLNGLNVVPSNTLDAGSRAAASGASYIGNEATSAFDFNGYIDEVRLYNRVLSPSEIQQLYNMSK